ncbi:MAG: RluA family pseudouridine synthase [Rubrivivax sp.]
MRGYAVEPPEAAEATEPTEPGTERREVLAGAHWHGQRLDKALAQAVPEFSRSHLQQLIEGGHVEVAGRTVRASAHRVRAGDRLAIELVEPEHSRAFRPEPLALDVVYEDEQVCVIDKPAGLVVHPGAGNWSGTLLNGLLHRDPASAQLPRAGIVHRLDKDTSGLMVVGRTLAAVTALVRAIAAREVQREYLALVHGQWPGPRRIEAALGRDPVSRVRMAVVAGGRQARTDVEVVARSAGYSALRCRLHTGRTHQIRVHLSHGGHPIVADALYGGRPALGLSRQALHAHRLAFSHPRSGEPMAFRRELPGDMGAAWEQVAEEGPA